MESFFKKPKFKHLKIPGPALVFALFFLFSPTLQAGETDWLFLPPANLFKPLLADPREPNCGLTVNKGFDRYDLSFGGTLDLIQLRLSPENNLAWGVLGEGCFKLSRHFWASYRMDDLDWWMGSYLSLSSGPFSGRLAFRHGVSHLGDAYDVSTLLPFPFVRDGLELTGSFQDRDSLRFFAGLGYWLYSTPTVDSLYLHGGIEAFTGWFLPSVRGFFAYDLKAAEGFNGEASHNIEAGFQWKTASENSSGFRAALVYYAGKSQYGQFYGQNDNHWGIGLFFDP